MQRLDFYAYLLGRERVAEVLRWLEHAELIRQLEPLRKGQSTLDEPRPAACRCTAARCSCCGSGQAVCAA